MIRPARFRKKPVEILAAPWDGTAEGATPITDWVLSGDGTACYRGPGDGDPDCPNRVAHSVLRYCPSCSFVAVEPSIAIDTLEGAVQAKRGDWIIRGVTPTYESIEQAPQEVL